MEQMRCSEPGCAKPAIGRELCGTHYMRQWRAGRIRPAYATPLRERLIEGREIDNKTDCWLWSGRLNDAGYGIIADKKRKDQRVHRLAYEFFVGELTAADFVCHRCDVRRCFNPAHLFKGTQQDNVRDMVNKGRSASGPRHSQATLSTEQVIEIRRLRLTNSEIASIYSINKSTVSRIKNGLRRKLE